MVLKARLFLEYRFNFNIKKPYPILIRNNGLDTDDDPSETDLSLIKKNSVNFKVRTDNNAFF